MGLRQICNDNNRRQLAVGAFPLQACKQLPCIHIVQMLFQDQHIRPRVWLGMAHGPEELFAGFGFLWTPAQRTRHRNQALRCITARVGDENSQAACTAGCVDGLRDSKRYFHPESAAHGDGAGDADFAPHQFDKAARDGQTQAGAAKATCGGRIGLSEGREEVFECRRLDAYAGILHCAAQADSIGTLFRTEYFQLYVAGRGEFDRVAQQVGESLAQTRGIALDHARQRRRRLNDQLDSLCHRLWGEHLAQSPHELGQIEWLVLERHLSGLYLG